MSDWDSLKAVMVQGVPTIYCNLCGVHGSWQWHGLLKVCPEEPRNANAKTWLAQTQAGKEPHRHELKKKDRKPAPNKGPKRKQPLRRELEKTTKPTSALVNKMAATIMDRARWASFDGGMCMVCLPQPDGPPNPPTSVDPVDIREGHEPGPPPRLLAPRREQRLEVDEDEGTPCPGCATTVLDFDRSAA